MPNSWNWHLWYQHLTSIRLDLVCIFVKGGNLYSICHAYLAWHSSCHTSINSGFTVITSSYHPIFHGTIPLVKLPSECILVEFLCSVWIIRRNIKMCDSWHCTKYVSYII